MQRKKDHTWETEQAIFPSKLSEIMKERQVSQEKLASALGVKRQTVSLYKTGQSSPNAEQLRKIAEFFGVSSDWLLGLSNEKEMNGDLAQAARYTGLPANSIKRLHELSTASNVHPKSLLLVVDRILTDRADDFITWVWRAAMAGCCHKTGLEMAELSEIRRDADIRLVEAANSGVSKTIEVAIDEYEMLCISTAIGIIRDSTDKALQDFKNKFSVAFQAEKSKNKNCPR